MEHEHQSRANREPIRGRARSGAALAGTMLKTLFILVVFAISCVFLASLAKPSEDKGSQAWLWQEHLKHCKVCTEEQGDIYLHGDPETPLPCQAQAVTYGPINSMSTKPVREGNLAVPRIHDDHAASRHVSVGNQ